MADICGWCIMRDISHTRKRIQLSSQFYGLAKMVKIRMPWTKMTIVILVSIYYLHVCSIWTSSNISLLND